jgi:hypothetical protein
LADLFDFVNPPAFATAPVLPDATIDIDHAAECEVYHEHVPTDL